MKDKILVAVVPAISQYELRVRAFSRMPQVSLPEHHSTFIGGERFDLCATELNIRARTGLSMDTKNLAKFWVVTC